MLEVTGLSFRRSPDFALSDVAFSVAAGEIHALVGPNGAGKSTLLRLVAGFVAPDSGAVAWCKQDSLAMSPATRAKMIGYMPQREEPSPLTVAETVALGLLPLHPTPDASGSEVVDAMQACGIDFLAQKPATGLSGGQFQRTLLARAFVHQPQLLILDEPTNSLDADGIFSLGEMLRTLAAKGVSVLVASHDARFVSSAADTVSEMQNGRIAASGNPATFFSDLA